MPRVGVITALRSEADCLRWSPSNTDFLNFVSGTGSVAAARASSQAIEAGCDTLVSYGYAGALDPALRAGDLLFGLSVSNEETTIETDGDLVTQLISKIKKIEGIVARSSLFYAAPSIIKTASQKSDLRQKGRWDAVDMESFAIGCAAQKHNFSFIIVRSIVDIADVSLPNNLSKIVDKRGATRGAAALWELLKTPREFPKYRGLAKAKKLADQSLRCVAPLLAQVRISGR
ncbi:MAG: hypothetical protein CMM45_10390 [Rhodospirillaceae bacterium]|nr:hypothetical protein [Rhodospirillaceae bacterium]